MLEPSPDLYRVLSPPGSRTHPTSGPESGPTCFPLFSDAPFLVWYHQHRKSLRLGQIHPSCLPPIRLWDEAEDSDHRF